MEWPFDGSSLFVNRLDWFRVGSVRQRSAQKLRLFVPDAGIAFRKDHSVMGESECPSIPIHTLCN
jgi:hypothetical protein